MAIIRKISNHIVIKTIIKIKINLKFTNSKTHVIGATPSQYCQRTSRWLCSPTERFQSSYYYNIDFPESKQKNKKKREKCPALSFGHFDTVAVAEPAEATQPAQ